ncbi:PTS sugar transporter subunit IIA [Galbitalea sp. SE-J8]|uniref:PTS sugar transporter subunit IIA n=1 Tax=Galbitalea sp. SE-J8 TaxID=3054952 RepID=UPI00259CBDF9|nr:PTS sugar transporter subunit IIA [Galbitalea sp. SE-J8]MDM4763095.1 PTS sugar transporter subunit IIA [Galbitalea sp. SE-J8]
MSETTTPLTDLLAESSIQLDAHASSKEDAVEQAGAALLAAGAIDASYIDAMLQREASVSTFVGEGVAIPHGTLAGKEAVKRDALVLLRFPDGVDWDGNEVKIAIGIAAKGNGHIALLSQLASILLEPEKAAALREATTTQAVYELLASEDDDDDANG